MNLRAQLKEILPNCLPKSPAEAVKGTELIKVVKHKLSQKYSDATLRYHFSVMSCDPASPIAKVTQGQGYYLRGRQPARLVESQPPLLRSREANITLIASAEALRLRIFQAVFERCTGDENRFVFPLQHTEDRSRAHVWSVPDAVLVDWKAGELSDAGFLLKRELLTVLDRPFELTSVRLALEARPESTRELFFQTLSAGAWAHRSELVYAAPIADQGLADELRSLGDRYGVSVTSMGIERHKLDAWQSPMEIRDLGSREIENLQNDLQLRRICAPPPRPGPDPGGLVELRERAPEIAELFRWIHRCMADSRAYTYATFRQLG